MVVPWVEKDSQEFMAVTPARTDGPLRNEISGFSFDEIPAEVQEANQSRIAQMDGPWWRYHVIQVNPPMLQLKQ